jgi:hypothetical protein
MLYFGSTGGSLGAMDPTQPKHPPVLPDELEALLHHILDALNNVTVPRDVEHPLTSSLIAAFVEAVKLI